MNIVKYPNSILTTQCQPVEKFDKDLHELLDLMAPAMRSNNGIGLAANQVGYPWRVFIMQDKKGKIWEFINPVITESSDTVFLNEGCLSAPGVFVQIARSKTVTVVAQDRNGEQFTVMCEDLEAVCAQHEIDHLDGKFYLEKASRQQRRAGYAKLGLK
jgi:peptide deformylase